MEARSLNRSTARAFAGPFVDYLSGPQVGSHAIDDRFDISSRVKSARAEGAAELVAYIALKRFEGCGEEFGPPCLVLLAFVQTRQCGGAFHADQNGLLGRAWADIAADVYRRIEFE